MYIGAFYDDKRKGECVVLMEEVRKGGGREKTER